jgi:SAM-dependent methyltransferase
VPRFMDFHQDLTLPAEAVAQIADDARNARADRFSVRQIELYHNPQGKVYGLLDGPDEDAIRQHHAAPGVPCSDVHQVDSLALPGTKPPRRPRWLASDPVKRRIGGDKAGPQRRHRVPLSGQKIAARLPLHTVQLCIHCQKNPAGFWVSTTRGTTARRPSCLSCCQAIRQPPSCGGQIASRRGHENTASPDVRAQYRRRHRHDQGGNVDRPTWLDQRRAAVLASYDQDAAIYDDHGYPDQAQQDWVARVLRACPSATMILDAPCGTGKYFPMVAAAGHRVVGADQSAGMLAQAGARNIAIALDQVRLQELPYAGEFDAVMTIDAMEHVPPEDWPLVLANLHRAGRPGSLLYLTVEEVADPVLEEAFATLTRCGLPAVRGELVDGDVAGYHYYPGRDRVTSWFDDARLQVIEEGFKQEDGWGYRHFLLQRARL